MTDVNAVRLVDTSHIPDQLYLTRIPDKPRVKSAQSAELLTGNLEV